MKNKEIKEAYNAIDSNKDLSEIILRLQILNEYLESLCNEINSNGFKSSFLYQWTFATEANGQKGHECYIKSNIFSANSSLRRITERLELEDLSEVTLRMLKDFICDLEPFITYFDENQDFSWLLLNTNSHISNFYFDLANHTFWDGQSGEQQEEKLALSSSTVFIIRQSIEYKLKRILAIDSILKNKKPFIQILKLCFKAIEKNSEFYTMRNFSFDIVKNIALWTNAFIHGGYRPEPWKTEVALNYLSSLYYSGEASTGKLFSLYAGIEVLEADLTKLKEKTEATILAEDNFEIRWLSKPEVAIIRK